MNKLETEEVVANYIVIQCAIRMMAPTSVLKTYLPGIAASFESLRVQNNFREALKAKEIKLLARGFQRFYDRRNPAAGRVKLPFGMDLALKAKTIMTSQNIFATISRSNADKQIRQERTFVAMAVGIHFMLRKSEHIWSNGTATPMKRTHLVFFDKQDKHIPYDQVGLTRAMIVMSNVEFAKADLSGYGRRISHVRQDDEEVCIVCILERWIVKTRDQFNTGRESGIYDINNMEGFTAYTLHKVMQATVTSLNIPGFNRNVTSHSLRYGGATMMAAAGFPQYLVAHYGGWTSDSKALRIYAKPTEEMSILVSKHFVDMARKEPSKQFIMEAIAQSQCK